MHIKNATATTTITNNTWTFSWSDVTSLTKENQSLNLEFGI